MMDYLGTALMTVAIGISIRAGGVVLVAAMLGTPAATAYRVPPETDLPP
jgi:ABC-type Mn2+/Zn2+ transport system permease subunit